MAGVRGKRRPPTRAATAREDPEAARRTKREREEAPAAKPSGLRDVITEVRSTAVGLHHEICFVASEDEAILAQSSDLDEAIDAFGEKAKDTWTDAEKRKDRKALSLIQLHLSNNILQEVLQEKTTAELWVKLEEICLSKDLTGRLHVKMKLFSHKLQEGGSAESSSFKAEALEVRGRTEQRDNYYHNNRDKSKGDRGRSKSKGREFSAYAHVDNGKLEPAVKCIFLGYGSGVKAYRLWNPETKKIVLSRNVVFNEAVMFNDSPSTDISDAIDSPDVSDDEQHRIGVQVEHAKENENVVPETNNDDNDVPPSPPFVQRQGRSIAADRPKRNITPPTRLIQECDIVVYALSCAEQVEHDIEPATYTEAIASVDKEKWVGAMQEEMQSLEKNGTWDVVHLPKQKKAVRCKWIFKRKEGLSPNEPPRFKARLVAKGFSQIPGVDYNDVFSPVVKHSSIRAFFGIVAMHDLELEQLDVKTAFLHGELEEDIYMDQPEGYVVPV
ncbi:hypothetical protein QYE76_058929 [Lolium multiflorum]|uniref:Retrotransposon protein, putative, Ty1-copia subclass n=1 Tax=Lolium multiflorum TaxID=4521 RepID=A0AAD8T810_LOLMU|nr:hypothetical protein QYE76_058929 [Lolium multiflorum]